MQEHHSLYHTLLASSWPCQLCALPMLHAVNSLMGAPHLPVSRVCMVHPELVATIAACAAVEQAVDQARCSQCDGASTLFGCNAFRRSMAALCVACILQVVFASSHPSPAAAETAAQSALQSSVINRLCRCLEDSSRDPHLPGEFNACCQSFSGPILVGICDTAFVILSRQSARPPS